VKSAVKRRDVSAMAVTAIVFAERADFIRFNASLRMHFLFATFISVNLCSFFREEK